jgi:hypothetical protein
MNSNFFATWVDVLPFFGATQERAKEEEKKVYMVLVKTIVTHE